MTFQLITHCVGLQADAEPVQELLREVAWIKPIKFKRGDTDVYLNAKPMGVSLLFEESSYFEANSGQQLLSEAPVLTAVFLYGDEHPEFQRYQGDMPQGLSFDMGRAEIRESLGPSALFDANFNTEAWDINERCRLFVDYAADLKRVLVMQVGLRPAT